MKNKKTGLRVAGIVLTAIIAGLLATCSSTPGGGMAAAPMADPTIKTAQNDKVGTFLVDAKGMALYMFAKDTENVSNCYGGCATAWPPLLVTDAPVLSQDLKASLVSTTTRTDGTKQLTYAGWPLYYYIKDKAAGDILGQDVGHVWYLLAPNGDLIKPAM
jgi:predicted lipoprotein with Yx(FWY)xxD motif